MGKAKKKKHCRTQGGRGVDYCDLIMNRHIIIKSHYQFDKLRKSERNAENYDKKNFVVVSRRYDFLPSPQFLISDGGLCST